MDQMAVGIHAAIRARSDVVEPAVASPMRRLVTSFASSSNTLNLYLNGLIKLVHWPI